MQASSTLQLGQARLRLNAFGEKQLPLIEFPQVVCTRSYRGPPFSAHLLHSDHAYFAPLVELIERFETLTLPPDPTGDLATVIGGYRAFIEQLSALFDETEVGVGNPDSTLLHRAALDGDVERGLACIAAGASIHGLSAQGENALHFAAHRGHVAFLEMLEQVTPRASIERLLMDGDADGKRPLHLACWGDPKPEVVAKLIGLGANANATNNYGYTPAHWAAKHGHVESLRMLVEAGARLDLVNANGDVPLDLAVRWAQDEAVLFLLDADVSERLLTFVRQGATMRDPQLYFEGLMNNAYRTGKPIEAVFYGLKLANLLQQAGNHILAAQLLNAARHLCPSEALQSYFLHRMAALEGLFIHDVLGRKVGANTTDLITKRRAFLASAREIAETEIDEGQPIDEVLHKYSRSCRRLFLGIINEAMRELGPPPCEAAFMCFGSLARFEMCRNSDIEWGILTEDDDLAHIEYYQHLARLVQLKCINMGETAVEIFRGQDRLPPAGFCIDTKVSPTGPYQLIGPPTQLAALQEDAKGHDESVVLSALLWPGYIGGNGRLFTQYRIMIASILDADDSALRTSRVEMLLRANHREFRPDLSNERRREQALGIKDELLRPLQMGMATLGLAHQLDINNTFGCIEALEHRGVFTAQGAQNLREAYCNVLSLRYHAHREAQEEQDTLLVPAGNAPVPEGNYLVADRPTRDRLRDLYRRIIPFAGALHEISLQGRVALNLYTSVRFEQPFLLPKMALKAREAMEGGRYPAAAEHCRQALALDPDQPESLQVLASIGRLEVGAFGAELEALIDLWSLAAERGDGMAQGRLAACYLNGQGVEKNPAEAWRLAYAAVEAGNPDGYWVIGNCYLDGKFVNKDPSRALEVFRQGHEEGSIRCTNALGYCYHNGQGVEEDHAEAVRLFRLAAEQRYAAAQCNLGVCYRNGQGVEQDHAEAIRLSRLAAEQGYAAAQYWLGVCYQYGKGIEQDLEEAVQLYRLAAEQGYAGAQCNLGVCYKNGQGVEQDLEEAVQLYRLAAEQGYAQAQVLLGRCYYNGQGVELDLEEAVRLYRLAVEQGHAQAQFVLGVCYYNGQGVELDLEEAVRFYQLAAEQGNASARCNLGVCYQYGQGVELDLEEAVQLYRLAVEQGYAAAQYWLGVCYQYGKGIEQDLEEAVRYYRLAAEQGNAGAQFNLGVCYYNGQGVELDLEEAVRLYQLAAEQGDVSAQLSLGVCYYTGQGVELDLEEAVRLYQLAAEQGNAQAQVLLGGCYYTGQGVEEDYAEAVRLFRLVAEQGNAQAQFALGVCYATGQGVEPDLAEALRLYRLAAEQGDASAQVLLGGCYYTGQGVEEDHAEAVRLFRLAAEQGHAQAQFDLGVCYYKGQGVEEDYAEAVRLFRLAAEQGHAQAQCNLGGCYYNGLGVEEDLEEGVRLYRLAAEQGNAQAQFVLGGCYYNGQGVEEDRAEAVRLFRLAAEQGDASAQFILGASYANGQGVEQDLEEAVRLYRLAAEQGDVSAQFNLGGCYATGQGVEQDLEEAVRLFRLAADQGHAEAQSVLSHFKSDD